jgi:hypothetical protein
VRFSAPLQIHGEKQCFNRRNGTPKQQPATQMTAKPSYHDSIQKIRRNTLASPPKSQKNADNNILDDLPTPKPSRTLTH